MSSNAQKLANGSTESAFEISFPKNSNGLDQHEEWFEYWDEGERKKLRIHDYADLFSREGLYEALVYEMLECNSPAELATVFEETLEGQRQAFADLRILDLGAGNGMVAEEFVACGAKYCVGIDLLSEACAAAKRDRPGIYADYLVADLCDFSERDSRKLDEHRLNCLLTVAALGFGDIPPQAFATAFNALTWEGWLGMTIKEDFLTADDPSGFASLIKSLIEDKVIDALTTKRYRHRLSVAGEPIYYIALVARKNRDIPAEMVQQLSV
jgi:SAM-dependent methyltransferase